VSRPVVTRLIARIVAMTLCTGVLAGLIVACGYKGPLTLPEPNQKAESGK